MDLKQLLKWVVWGSALNRLSLAGIGSLKGNIRTPPPDSQPYELADFQKEFDDQLPENIQTQFSTALRLQKQNDLRAAFACYAKLTYQGESGKEYHWSERSAVVAYNLYLLYKQCGHYYLAHRYWNLYRNLHLSRH